MSLGAVSFSVRDYDGEVSSFGANTGAITALNLAGVLTQVGALRTAVAGISNGVIANESLTAFNTIISPDLPADENAQRERKWLVSFADDTQFLDALNTIANPGYGKKYNVEIPCADYTGRLLANTDIADLANADIAAFVTAFEALCKTINGGTPKVLKMTAVGRRG